MGNNAEFNHLHAEARELGAELGAEQPPGGAGTSSSSSSSSPASGAAPAQSSAQLAARDVRAMLEIVARLLKPISPAAAAVYTEAVMVEVSESVGAVLVKYDLNLFGLLGRFEVEIKAAIAVAPVAWATVVAIRDSLEAKAAAAARPLNPAQRSYADPMFS